MMSSDVVIICTGILAVSKLGVENHFCENNEVRNITESTSSMA